MTAATAAMEQLLDAESQLAELDPRPFHLPMGPLAPIVQGAFEGSSRTDWVSCGPRARVGAVLRSCAISRLVDAGVGARPYRLLPSSAAPGQRALHAVGLAISRKERVLCLLSDASLASGAFHEALNIASGQAAPVTFLVALHPHGPDAPFAQQLSASPTAIAAAFGLRSWEVAGNAAAVREAVQTARQDEGPALIVTRITRS